MIYAKLRKYGKHHFGIPLYGNPKECKQLRKEQENIDMIYAEDEISVIKNYNLYELIRWWWNK